MYTNRECLPPRLSSVHNNHRATKDYINMALFSSSVGFSRTFSVIHRNISLGECFQSKKVPDSAIPKPLLKDVYGSFAQPENGAIYDKKPFRMRLEKGKVYAWCLCGKSKSQPLCDGTHTLVMLKITQRPIKFMVEETKDYWLCNCKQTTHRPFCDGTHKEEHIQKAIR